MINVFIVLTSPNHNVGILKSIMDFWKQILYSDLLLVFDSFVWVWSGNSLKHCKV